MSAPTIRRLLAACAVAVVLLAGCGSSDDAASPTTTAAPATTVAQKPLKILVSNDDGYAAEGIDTLVVALQKLPDVEITVYAPLTQQSGTGGKMTDGPLKVTDVKLKSGYPAKAVEGFPSDSVRVAMDDDGVKPDVVITGINEGQNLGPAADLSGTVGAARAAVARNVPALATSSGLAGFDYAAGVPFIVDWIKEHRAALLAGTAPVEVASLNTPSCTPGTNLRGLVEVKPDLEGEVADALKTQDCASTTPESSLTTDIAAFNNGFATLTELPAEAQSDPYAG